MKNVKMIISLSKESVERVKTEYYAITGSEDYYDNPDLWDDIKGKYLIKMYLYNISLDEAQIIAEPVRILYPSQNVSLIDEKGDFIGYTSWDDQMKYFWEYPTFTKQGADIMATVAKVMELQGKKASFE